VRAAFPPADPSNGQNNGFNLFQSVNSAFASLQNRLGKLVFYSAIGIGTLIFFGPDIFGFCFAIAVVALVKIQLNPNYASDHEKTAHKANQVAQQTIQQDPEHQSPGQSTPDDLRVFRQFQQFQQFARINASDNTQRTLTSTDLNQNA
jgi:hypothetical protein